MTTIKLADGSEWEEIDCAAYHAITHADKGVLRLDCVGENWHYFKRKKPEPVADQRSEAEILRDRCDALHEITIDIRSKADDHEKRLKELETFRLRDRDDDYHTYAKILKRIEQLEQSAPQKQVGRSAYVKDLSDLPIGASSFTPQEQVDVEKIKEAIRRTSADVDYLYGRFINDIEAALGEG